MLDEGAAIVDVGGESTRPGARGHPARRGAAARRARARVARRLAVSIDTAKAEVARRALELGAELVNDVTALRGDPELAGVVAGAGCYLCLMHMRGEPRTMQADPRYDDVVSEVKAFLEQRLAFAVAAGHPRGAGLPRPRNRVRQDGRAQLRARAAPARAGRDRPAGADRFLAQELARHGFSAIRRGDGRIGGRVGRRRGRRLRARRIDPACPRRARPRRGAAGRPQRSWRGVRIELVGLELFGYHGVHRGEREQGQRFLYDIELEVGESRPRRPDRGRRRLQQGRRMRARGRDRPATGCSRRSRRDRGDAHGTFPARPGQGPGAQARRPPGRVELEFAAVTAELP